MKAAAIVLWVLVLVLPVLAQSSANTCALPGDLQRVVATKYPGSSVVTESDLNEDDRQFFQKDHQGACPGLVKVDFYGDSKPTFALELISREGVGSKTKLIVARQIGIKWTLILLHEVGGNAPVVWSDKPGDYEGVWGDKLHATHSVIVWQGYESWAVLYAWSGRKVEHIQLID